MALNEPRHAQSDQSSLSAWRNLGSLATHCAHSEDWADAQADPSLRWGHTHFVGFVIRGSNGDFIIIL